MAEIKVSNKVHIQGNPTDIRFVEVDGQRYINQGDLAQLFQICAASASQQLTGPHAGAMVHAVLGAARAVEAVK